VSLLWLWFPGHFHLQLLILKAEYAAKMWNIIELFGYKNLPKELNGVNIHRLENILTLEPGLHSCFDDLSLWLEATVCHLLNYHWYASALMGHGH
jgi:hypothetical protein